MSYIDHITLDTGLFKVAFLFDTAIDYNSAEMKEVK